MDEIKMRFERIEAEILGGKIRNRCQSIECVNSPKDMPGDFLSRLWTLFGVPNSISDGVFSYYICDRETGLEFTAYSGASGPAYGGYPNDAEDLRPVLEIFDDLIDKTPLTDCRIELETEFGTYRTGVKNGEVFEQYD